MIYEIKKDGLSFCVVKKGTTRAVFYGSKLECKEWIERNGHDGNID